MFCATRSSAPIFPGWRVSHRISTGWNSAGGRSPSPPRWGIRISSKGEYETSWQYLNRSVAASAGRVRLHAEQGGSRLLHLRQSRRRSARRAAHGQGRATQRRPQFKQEPKGRGEEGSAGGGG